MSREAVSMTTDASSLYMARDRRIQTFHNVIVVVRLLSIGIMSKVYRSHDMQDTGTLTGTRNVVSHNYRVASDDL